MKKSIWLAAGAGLLMSVGGTARAEDVTALAAQFGARPAIQDIHISPNGQKLVIVAPAAPRGDAVLVVDLAGNPVPKPVLAATNPGERVSHCIWPTDDRLVCRIVKTDKSTGDVIGFNRMLTLAADGSDVKMLTQQESSHALGVLWYGGGVIDWHGDRPGRVLMMRQYVQDSDLGTRVGQKKNGIGVESVDVKTLQRTTVEQPERYAISFGTDGLGNVRIMGSNPTSSSGYDKNFVDYFYRKQGERGWQSLGRVTINPSGSTSGFEPEAVDPKLNAVYGFDSDNGYKALYRIKLDGSMAKELVLEKPGVDVDGLIQIGRDGRVVGATYATEYRTTDFFDPELKALRSALGKALPGQPLVDFLDSSEDEDALLMWAGSDVDPGLFYLYHKSSHKLEQLLPIRPQLAGRQMAQMKPVEYPAADGTMIPGYLTLPVGSTGKNLPSIVMPHGGPSSRDEWGFDWLVQFFAARGFAVLQPNFRGSAGYGESWFQRNGFQSWRTAIGDVDDAGRWLIKQGIANPQHMAIFGWSYGGYAALQSGVLDPGLYKAIVAVAPVTDLGLLKQERLDYTDYTLVAQMVGNGAHVTEGSPADNAARISVPVLMFQGTWDTNVDIAQGDLMQNRLQSAGKQVEFMKFDGLSHSLDDADARTLMLARTDAFLRKTMGMPAN